MLGSRALTTFPHSLSDRAGGVGSTAELEYSIAVPSANKSSTCSVNSIFENNYIKKDLSASGGAVAFTDSLRGHATIVYRVECSAGEAPFGAAANPNLVYNGGYEICVNPAVPDGNYVAQPVDQSGGGFFFADFRDSVAGRASLRMSAPANGAGMTLSPYTIPRVDANSSYIFSVWTRGSNGGCVTFNFAKSIFTFRDATGRETSTLVVSTTTKWAQTRTLLTATADPITACPYGCRGWLSYTHTTMGDVWLDELSLVAV